MISLGICLNFREWNFTLFGKMYGLGMVTVGSVGISE